MEDLSQTLIKGYRLLLRSPLLACLSVFVLLILYSPSILAGLVKNRMATALLLGFPLSLIMLFVVNPFLKACLLGSYLQVLQSSAVTMKEFVLYGRRYYRSLVALVLYQMAAFIPFMALIFAFGIKFQTLLQHSLWIYLATEIFMLVLVPFNELAPIMIVLTRQEPLKAVMESYRLVWRNLAGFLPLLVLFWIIPAVLRVALAGIRPETTAEHLYSSLISVLFMMGGLPTMVIYLSEKIGPLENLEEPMGRPKLGRTYAVGIAIILIFIGSFLAFEYSTFFPSRLKMPAELKTPGILAGSDFLSKRLFFEDTRLGSVTDIVIRKPDPKPDIEIGLAGTKGALFIDESFNIKSAVTFNGQTAHVDIMDVDADGQFEFVNRGSWAIDASLMDHTGKTLWTYGGQPGVDDMAAGDIDGDGTAEFVVGFNGSGGVHLLDKNGKKKWEQPDGNVWHVELVDTDGDGTLEIVHSNAAGQITVRDGQGNIIRQTVPNVTERRLYFSHFSLSKWPSKKAKTYLLLSGDDSIWLLDFLGYQVAQLKAPKSSKGRDARGVPVKLASNEPEYFAVIVDFSIWNRCILYVYQPSLKSSGDGELLYQEILPESCASIAALSQNNSETESILIGGEGKVWQYKLQNVAENKEATRK